VIDSGASKSITPVLLDFGGCSYLRSTCKFKG